jgi:hypothetical protein
MHAQDLHLDATIENWVGPPTTHHPHTTHPPTYLPTYLSQQQHEVPYHAHSSHTKNVPQDQKECLSSSFAKGISVDGCLDIGILIDEFHYFFQAPHATLKNAHEVYNYFVSRLCSFFLDIGNNNSDCLNNGDDQRSKRSGPEMVPKCGEQGLQQ